jgi:hypothetical protein
VRPALNAVCVHRNVKGIFLVDLHLLLFVFIVKLKVAFREACFGCCWYTS